MKQLNRTTLLRAAAPFALLFGASAVQAQADHQHHHEPQVEQHGERHAAPTLNPAARAQVAAVARAVERYRDFAAAEREGWRKFGGDEPLMGEHYYPPENLGWEEYIGRDARLDFTRPSNLMYTEIGGRKVLTGVAFIVRLADGEPMPQGFAGDADRWHAHDFVAAINAATEERPLLRWLANWWLDSNYFGKGDDRGRLAMVHVWATLPNPDGIFADHNRLLPYMKLGLPESHARGASMDAALGLELAAPKGCENAAGGKLWIADAKRQQTQAIERACAASASAVKQALAEHRGHPAMLNTAAEQAWRSFDAVWQRVLTPKQQERVAAMSEHGEGGHGGH